MTDRDYVKLSFDEDPKIVAQIDKIAEEEGTSRAAIIRRFIRRQLFSLPTVPTFGNTPEPDQSATATTN